MAVKKFNPHMPLAQVRQVMRMTVLAGKRVNCPVCEKSVKMNRRSLSETQVVALTALSLHGGEASFRELMGRSDGEMAKLVHWVVIEPGSRGKGAITRRGTAFVNGHAKVQKYIHTYNGNLQYMSGKKVGVDDYLQQGQEDS